MGSLCWCTVAVVALATSAAAEGTATQAFLKQVLVGVPTRQGPQGDKEDEETLTLPDVNDLVRELIVDAFDPNNENSELLPDFVGSPQAQVVDVFARLGPKGAGLRIRYEYDDSVPAGRVIAQEPKAGTRL